MRYIVAKADELRPANEVYFAYDLREAISVWEEIEEETGEFWFIAEILPRKNWMLKFIMWLNRHDD